MYSFADAAQKLYVSHLTNKSTIEQFEEACFELLKYRRECHSKRKEALWNARLQSIIERSD